MSVSAIGVSARVQTDGLIRVKVQLREDATERSLGFLEITGATLETVKAQLQTELDARALAEGSATLQAAVVGQILATSRAGGV